MKNEMKKVLDFYDKSDKTKKFKFSLSAILDKYKPYKKKKKRRK